MVLVIETEASFDLRLHVSYPLIHVTSTAMPVGIQRLNAKKSQPNDRIVFIKPLKGPDEAVAQDFLERIAAQCRKDR